MEETKEGTLDIVEIKKMMIGKAIIKVFMIDIYCLSLAT